MPFPTGDAANSIPVIFSKKLQARFYRKTVLQAICNTDWEGEISGQGSKVVINSKPHVAIKDYDGTVTYDGLETNKLELAIDHAKTYAFKTDDIQDAQSIIMLANEASGDASSNMAVDVDGSVLGSIYTQVPASNQLEASGTGLVVTKDDILEYIIAAGTRLDEQNIPQEGRWIVFPPWVCGLIKNSDLKDASLAGDGTSIMRNGMVGQIDRFKVYCSNNLAAPDAAGLLPDQDGYDPTTAIWQCLAGTKHFASFASQFVKHESLRLESTFGTGHRGLKVYGFKATKPEAGILLPLKKQ